MYYISFQLLSLSFTDIIRKQKAVRRPHHSTAWMVSFISNKALKFLFERTNIENYNVE